MQNLIRRLDQRPLRTAILIILGLGIAVALLLLLRSFTDFTRSGPQMQEAIVKNYALYVVYAVSRLAFWAATISALLAGAGILVYNALNSLFGWQFRTIIALVAGATSLGLVTAYQFLQQLLFMPSKVIASWNYSEEHLYPIWELLDPGLLSATKWFGLSLAGTIVLAAIFKASNTRIRLMHTIGLASLSTLLFFSHWTPDARFSPSGAIAAGNRPNILMIGSDTLRADHLGIGGNPRDVSPVIDGLAREGTYFANCYVPLARTAPSLTSILTGAWPHDHGIRDNYISDPEARITLPALPKLFRDAGYHTIAIGDWAAGDLGKLALGFDEAHVPEDQWNLKFLLRQGPKDIRLFISLFVHNPLGKLALPELYYLAGTPLTKESGRETRHHIARLAQSNKPFFINLFIASTHAPFGSVYPDYLRYSSRDYRGQSKFVMSGLKDPSSIIAAQEKGKEAFDVEQLIALYDGAIRGFDDEVGHIMQFLHDTGLADNTIVIIYSDHGTDFFERGTWGQGNTVFGNDPSAHIPLLILDPRHQTPKKITSAVRSIDIAPTLLELAGLPVPDTMRGVSLAQSVRNGDDQYDLPVFQETGLWLGNIPGLEKNHLRYPSLLDLLYIPNKETGTLAIKPDMEERFVAAKDRMIRKGDWKLIYLPMTDGATYWLYNTREDPNGNINLAETRPDVFLPLKKTLIDWMSQDQRRQWQNEHLISASTPDISQRTP